jgi:hypothetical protein
MIYMRMPSQVYLREKNAEVKTIFTTLKFFPSMFELIEVQLVRVRTTNNIWGFSLFNKLGNKYEE